MTFLITIDSKKNTYCINENAQKWSACCLYFCTRVKKKKKDKGLFLIRRTVKAKIMPNRTTTYKTLKLARAGVLVAWRERFQAENGPIADCVGKSFNYYNKSWRPWFKLIVQCLHEKDAFFIVFFFVFGWVDTGLAQTLHMTPVAGYSEHHVVVITNRQHFTENDYLNFIVGIDP